MTSLTVDRSFEFAPHATRTVAMALTISLNLVILLFALRPTTPFEHSVPPPVTLIATLLQPPLPAVTPPILNAVPRITAPKVHLSIPRLLAKVAPLAVAITPVTTMSTPATTSTQPATTGIATANRDATIAYATASAPPYPIQAVRAGIEGTVTLKVLVAANGKPLQVVIAHSSGSRLLDDAARQHVLAAWRFHPAIRDGHAIEAWALVPVEFKLHRF